MSDPELWVRVAAYLLSSYALGLASFAIARWALPASSRAGLLLLATLAGQLVLCAVVVQTLGLLGLLRTLPYLAVTLAAGAGVTWLGRAWQPNRALWRLTRCAFRLWFAAPGLAAGWLALLFLLFLAQRYLALPRDVDALSLHAPPIVAWIQSGVVTFGSEWNYPLVWEYQFAPGFLLLRSDALVVLPALLGIATLLLAVRELASRLRLGGQLGQAVALLVITLPVVWRDPMKNDPLFAGALLLGLFALDRVARGAAGAFWLLHLACFLILGTKPSGFLYAALLLGAAAVLFLLRRSRPDAPACSWKMALLAGSATVLLLASASAVQIDNGWRHGNPTYPIRLQIGEWVLFPGPGNLAGSSILDNACSLETWRQLLVGALSQGVETPWLALLLAATLLRSLAAGWRAGRARSVPRAAALTALALPWAAALLWLLYLATPWSYSNVAGTRIFLVHGASLRYALAPLALCYLLAASLLRPWLRSARAWRLLTLGVVLLIGWKWAGPRLLGSEVRLAWLLLGAAMLPAGLTRALAGRRLAGRWRSPGVPVVAAALALVVAMLYIGYVERRRPNHWPAGRWEVAAYVWGQVPPGSIIGISRAEAYYRFQLHGPGLANRLVPVALGADGELPVADGIAYLYVAAEHIDLARTLAGVERHGWRRVALAADGSGALLARAPAP
jgi:hypothetical protein